MAEWVFKNNKHAGATTNTLPSAKCLYMSIRGTGGALAVAAIVTKNREKPEAFEKNFMVAILDECGLALEKEMTVREKQAVEERAHQETSGPTFSGPSPRSAHAAHRHHRQDQVAWRSLSTSCARRSASSTATPRPPPAAGR